MKTEKNPITHLSPPEMARLIGVTEQTVRRLTKEGVLPKAERGTYDPFVALPAYCEHLRKAASNQPSGPGGNRLTTARARRAEAEAEMAEMKLQELRRELVPLREMENEFSSFRQTLFSLLRMLPSRLGMNLSWRREEIVAARALVDDLWRELVAERFDRSEVATEEENTDAQARHDAA